MSRALDQIVVVDFTSEFWGSLAGALLADFGADVVRIDQLPRPASDGNDGSPSWNYEADLVDRNKSSLALDLDAPRGVEILKDLLCRADVLLTDLPRTRLQELGLDEDAVRGLKADIIYAHGSGFGPEGPDRDLPAIDELAAARTGMMPILPQPDEPPVYPGHGMMYTSVMLAFGVMAALLHRDNTGEGQRIDTSLLAGNMYGASLDLQAFLAMGGERFLHPVARLDAGNPMSGTMYKSKDGRWVTLTMPDTDRWWPDLAAATGLDVNDPRFDSHEKRCGENRLLLIEVFEKAFREKSADHWRDVFEQRQMSADVIEDYSYPANDEQARRNRYVLELEHPSLGAIKTLGFPIFMSDTPATLERLAPCAGQHTQQVLHEHLGYSAAQIRELEAEGVIA
jgi:formyl-CoA transferase